MGRITDLIPALYHGKDNDLIRFAEALDVDVKGFERQVKGITDLINVDKCPDEKLPYLAALTNCPLIGNDPILWRRQIKNWPYILKLKGTERSLELVLDSVGAASWNIKTFFRNSVRDYVTTKPTGQPFKDSSGLWHNIRTHYFGIEFVLSKDFLEKQDFNWDAEEIKEKLNFWFERGKPYHAELLNMIILPPKLIHDICYWDVCGWEHIEPRIYDWGMLTPEPSIFDGIPIIRRNFERNSFTISDTAFWGVNTWDNVPVRLLLTGQISETGIVCSFEWGDGESATLYPNILDSTQWDYSSTFSRSFGHNFERGFFTLINWEEFNPQVIGTAPVRGFICNLIPHWDLHTWSEYYSLAEEIEQQPVKVCVHRDMTALLDWNAEREDKYLFWDKDRWDYQESEKYDAPLPKWSSHKTWAGSNTWETTTEQAGTWEVGTWKLQEA